MISSYDGGDPVRAFKSEAQAEKYLECNEDYTLEINEMDLNDEFTPLYYVDCRYYAARNRFSFNIETTNNLDHPTNIVDETTYGDYGDGNVIMKRAIDKFPENIDEENKLVEKYFKEFTKIDMFAEDQKSKGLSNRQINWALEENGWINV